ncbi:MAG: HDOD domain-containing protein [Proteobacteria bacterium]|nr:HDOD domain-containing protein [Pseudomonadota bacterium]MCP4920831.1 HDOD domain-containing protein [Pseudomonadota bacterium]
MTNEAHSTTTNLCTFRPEPAPTATARDIMDRVERRWTRPQTMPALTPGIARQVRTLAARPSVTWNDAFTLFGQDPALAALAIREANTHRKAVSLAEALDVLGLPGIRRLLKRMAQAGALILDPAVNAAMTAVQHHSWRVSRAVRTVAMYTTLDSARVATAALLAELGMAAGLMALCDIPEDQIVPEVAPMMDMLSAGQNTLGWFVADSWALPTELQTTIANGGALEISGHEHPVLAAILIARAVVAELGLELDLPGLDVRPPHPAMLVDALSALGLSDRQFLLIRRQVRESLMG